MAKLLIDNFKDQIDINLVDKYGKNAYSYLLNYEMLK